MTETAPIFAFAGIPEEVIGKVLHHSAAELYGLS